MSAAVVPFWMKENLQILYYLKRLAEAIGSEVDDFYVVCNRLHLVTPEELRLAVQGVTGARVMVLYEEGVERSVAGAWNHGIRTAFLDGHGTVVCAAVDTFPDTGCVKRLVSLAANYYLGGLVSGVADDMGVPPDDCESCDFALFALTRETINKHGWFDAHYKPAYFEDNDYHTRVILAGGLATQVKAASFHHDRSLTIRLEPEAAHHVHHWFEHNRARYKAKWGVDVVSEDVTDIMRNCYLHPWNDPNLPLTFWERA